jgi:hypothetical protein
MFLEYGVDTNKSEKRKETIREKVVYVPLSCLGLKYLGNQWINGESASKPSKSAENVEFTQK